MVSTPNAKAADYDILPLNVDIVEAFMALQTQWRIGPMGGRLGIDYQAAATVLELLELDREQRRIAFDGIRLMELAALETMENGRRNTEPKRHPKGRR